jgi:adenylate cyclase
VSQPEPETRETERRRATVMFADLTGFTSLVEQEGDEVAYEVVAACLKLMDEIARRHGATVDKYLGDCIMAVFGVPKAVENAPRAALNAAIEIRERARRFNREQSLSRPLDVHTGIDTGPLIWAT